MDHAPAASSAKPRSTDGGFLAKPRESSFRKGLFVVHWLLGIVFGLYFGVVCITGAAVVYKKELEQLAIPTLLRVPPADQRASFAQMTRQVQERYPDHRLSNAYLYSAEGATWSFRLQGKDGRTQVYVNPYTAEIVGHDKYDRAFLQWVYDLHSDLLLGSTGLVVNAIGGFALLGMCLTGLVIWWPGIRKVAAGFHYELRAGWKRQVYDLHKVAGIAVLVPLALLAVTGAYWGFPTQYEAALGLLSNGEGRRNAPAAPPLPAATAPAASAPVASASAPPGLDVVLARALAAMPEGEPTLFTFPSRPGQPYSLRKKLPGDWRTIGDHSVYIHPANGEVLRVDRHHELPLGVRLHRDIYGLHFGSFWGHPTRIAWVVVGVAGFALFATGWLMYWNRVLVKRWRRLRARPIASPLPAPLHPATPGTVANPAPASGWTPSRGLDVSSQPEA
jgi:uncharacterized iron-regulated membrane protein